MMIPVSRPTDTIPHTSEQDTLPVASLTSKQPVPYQIRDGTDCPGGLVLRTNP
jgi:hypothetical protein